MKIIREWLKEIRLAKGLSQMAVAQEATGISQQLYGMIETGERRPSVKNAKKIAAVLGFDWQLFYPDEESTA